MDFAESAHKMGPGGFKYPFGAFLIRIKKNLTIKIGLGCKFRGDLKI
jgi:hypothetical protein